MNNLEGIKIRQDIQPGDMGQVLYLHGLLYAKEYDFGLKFEGYVAQSIAEFALLDDLEGSRLWVAEADEQVVGTIAIMKRSETEAQLRWYLLHPDYRGRGLGQDLFDKALSFCRENRYRKLFLWTVKELEAACHIYEKAGFRPTEEKSHALWGKKLTEVRYDLDL